MAGTLLHITLSDAALEDARVPERTRQAALSFANDFRLGAVLVDLPFFENLFASGLRILVKREIRLGVWGEFLHLRSPRTLCQHLLDGADDASGRAMALGAVTHLAIDSVFHKEISKRVMAMADGKKRLNSLHKRIEDQMDLHVHLERLGHSGIGTPYVRQVMTLSPHAAWNERFRQAILAVHGAAPSRRRLDRWLKSLALFGRLNASPIYPWTVTRPDGDEEIRRAAVRLADEAVGLACEYLGVGWRYLEGEDDAEAFETAIPDVNLADGGEASPPRENRELK